MIKRITTTEEVWPGQKKGVATARIEVWTDDEGQSRPLEVGRITAGRELFTELRDLIEGAIRESDEGGDRMKRGDIYTEIELEVQEAIAKWESMPRSQRPMKDAEKPIGLWVEHIRRYLVKAGEALYYRDRRIFYTTLIKLAGLCVRCIEVNADESLREADK